MESPGRTLLVCLCDIYSSFYISVWFVCSVVLASGVQQRDAVLFAHVPTLFRPFPTWVDTGR